MTDDVTDLRKGDRFDAVDVIGGSFNALEVTVLNLSLGGGQIMHAQPIRIGTRARFEVRHAGASATVFMQVVWSHLSQTPEGLRYRSGVKLDAPDVQYAFAINTLVRAGFLKRDTESLERKRQRQTERELRRLSSPKLTVTPPPTT
jgi:hypothetical protein